MRRVWLTVPFRNVPAVGARYWTAISLASVFGANLGDFVSHDLYMGHVRGLPVLAAIFAAIVFAERRSRLGNEAWYWLAIVTLRTAATNLADLGTHDLRLGYAGVIAVLALLLLAVVWPRRADQSGLPKTDASYWLAMLIAGTLGTALGDAGSEGLGFGEGPASVGFGVVLAVLLAMRAPYWAVIVAVRTAGTTVGDLLADTVNLPVSTVCTGVVLAMVLLTWRQRPVTWPQQVLPS